MLTRPRRDDSSYVGVDRELKIDVDVAEGESSDEEASDEEMEDAA